ncbi:cGMP-dependent protein kinase 1-like [Sycon ciliatum]|uniref:cGMP-dependent protein kinase 1-like n=1 Tax=Sycon ciliatum TaxID=27933 RepID=UPI0031F61839
MDLGAYCRNSLSVKWLKDELYKETILNEELNARLQQAKEHYRQIGNKVEHAYEAIKHIPLPKDKQLRAEEEKLRNERLKERSQPTALWTPFSRNSTPKTPKETFESSADVRTGFQRRDLPVIVDEATAAREEAAEQVAAADTKCVHYSDSQNSEIVEQSKQWRKRCKAAARPKRTPGKAMDEEAAQKGLLNSDKMNSLEPPPFKTTVGPGRLVTLNSSTDGPAEQQQQETPQPTVKLFRDFRKRVRQIFWPADAAASKPILVRCASRKPKMIAEKKFLWDRLEEPGLQQLFVGVVNDAIDRMVRVHYPDGEYIVEENAVAPFLIILTAGCVAITREGKSEVQENTVVLKPLLLNNGTPHVVHVKAEGAQVWGFALSDLDYRDLARIRDHQSADSEVARLEDMRDLSAKVTRYALFRLAVADPGIMETRFDSGAKIWRDFPPAETVFWIVKGAVEIVHRKDKTKRSLRTSPGSIGRHNCTYPSHAIADGGPVSIIQMNLQAFEIFQEELKAYSELESPRKTTRTRYAHVTVKELTSDVVIGQGTFGIIYLAQLNGQLPGQHPVFAIKELERGASLESMGKYLKSECVFMLNLNSEYVASAHGAYRDNHCLYYIMDACLGGDLNSFMKYCSEHRLGSHQTKRYIAGHIVEGLSYLHRRGVVHRDLKCGNVLVHHDRSVRLTDFGCAKRLAPGELTYTTMGTHGYMAPEVLLESGHDVSADYWSLGAAVYYMKCWKHLCGVGSDADFFKQCSDFKPRDLRTVLGSDEDGAVTADFVASLCRVNRMQRLGNIRFGIQEIRDHPFFMDLDWERLRRRNLPKEYYADVPYGEDNPTGMIRGKKPEIRNPPDKCTIQHEAFEWFQEIKW